MRCDATRLSSVSVSVSVRVLRARRRPWYRRTVANPHLTSISTPYLDSAGAGKVLTISQAIFEGMMERNLSDCNATHDLLPGGCNCTEHNQCRSRASSLSLSFSLSLSRFLSLSLSLSSTVQ